MWTLNVFYNQVKKLWPGLSGGMKQCVSLSGNGTQDSAVEMKRFVHTTSRTWIFLATLFTTATDRNSPGVLYWVLVEGTLVKPNRGLGRHKLWTHGQLDGVSGHHAHRKCHDHMSRSWHILEGRQGGENAKGRGCLCGKDAGFWLSVEFVTESYRLCINLHKTRHTCPLHTHMKPQNCKGLQSS